MNNFKNQKFLFISIIPLVLASRYEAAASNTVSKHEIQSIPEIESIYENVSYDLY